jgi:SAM-dependent methyltransferase
MKLNRDAYGKQLLDEYLGNKKTSEIIERDDNLIATGSTEGLYFTEYEDWSEAEQEAIGKVRGKVLDIGCGAGRHSLYLQNKGFDVTAIDNSNGAVKVCKLRGLKKALVRPVEEIDKFPKDSFETIIMLGNNFGLFSSRRKAKAILQKMSQLTVPNAQIIAGTLDPYQTADENHLSYHRLNRRRGRMPGQIRMRVRYHKIVGDWFDYLFVSPAEMEELLQGTDWQIKEFINSGNPNYIAVIEKRGVGK